MKHRLFSLLTLVSLGLLANVGYAKPHLVDKFPARVENIIQNEISTLPLGTTIVERHVSDLFSDGGLDDWPKGNEEYFQDLDANVDVDSLNEMGMGFAGTSALNFDRKYTKGNRKYDRLQQHGLRSGRRDIAIIGLPHTIAASRTMENWERRFIWVKIRMPKEAKNPLRTDIVYRPELVDSTTDLRLYIDSHDLYLQAQLDSLKNANKDVVHKSDIGLTVGLGQSAYSIADFNFNGPTVSFTYRYYDVAIRGFGGQTYHLDTNVEQFGTQLVPRVGDNHFEGGELILWAPLQDGQYGKYCRAGLTGLHAQTINLHNDSKVQGYYGGGVVTLSYPIWRFIPEVSGTIGYGATNEASSIPNMPDTKKQGLSGGISVLLSFGNH